MRVSPGERLILNLTLDEGRYRISGPQLGFAVEFRVERGPSDQELGPDPRRSPASPGPGEPQTLTLGAGAQRIGLTNDTRNELVVKVERIAPRDDALTAAQASALPLFRDLFPAETLSAGRSVGLETMTLVVTELDDADGLYQRLGDARAFSVHPRAVRAPHRLPPHTRRRTGQDRGRRGRRLRSPTRWPPSAQRSSWRPPWPRTT